MTQTNYCVPGYSQVLPILPMMQPNPTQLQSSTPYATHLQGQSADLTVTTTPVIFNEGMPEAKDSMKTLLSPSHISYLRVSSVSQENFSTSLVKELFFVEEQSTCYVRRVGKPKHNEKNLFGSQVDIRQLSVSLYRRKSNLE